LIGWTLDPPIHRIARIDHVKAGSTTLKLDKRDTLCLPQAPARGRATKDQAAERPGFVLALRSGSLGGRE
jgi:hypothetical protein